VFGKIENHVRDVRRRPVVKHLAQRSEVTGVDHASNFWREKFADHVAFLTLVTTTRKLSGQCAAMTRTVRAGLALQRGVPASPLGICQKVANMNLMPAVATGPMIRREMGDDHICLLTFDRPESGANIFDAATLDELNEHLDFVENDASLRGLIIASAKKSIFVAGADLKTLLQRAQSGDMRAFIAKGQQVFNRLAGLKIPSVAAIHGASAGGGYEVALACDYRVATDDPATRIGLPETTLGLIPAWGGCTRLPRLIGAEKAAEVILKGKLYSAQEALKLGLVDEIAPRDQVIERARKKLAE